MFKQRAPGTSDTRSARLAQCRPRIAIGFMWKPFDPAAISIIKLARQIEVARRGA
jgi:hypothetical protein